MARIPLGLGPSLHQLRSRSLCLVGRLPGVYAFVRLPTPVHHRLRLLAFPMRTAVRESELSTDGQTWDIPGSDAILLRVICRNPIESSAGSGQLAWAESPCPEREHRSRFRLGLCEPGPTA